MKQNKTISAAELESIERYLTGQMDESESRTFKEKIATNPELSEKTAEIRLLLLSIKEASLEDSLKKEGKLVALNKDRFPAKRKFPIKWVAAAAVIITAGLFTWFNISGRENTTTVYSRYYNPDPGLATAMSITYDYEFEKAMVEYKNGEFDKAGKTWTRLLEQKPGNDTLTYFIAAASQAKGDTKSALKNLHTVVNQENSAFYKDACWYLGLAYLKEGIKEKAIRYLKLSENPEAAKVIDEISKI